MCVLVWMQCAHTCVSHRLMSGVLTPAWATGWCQVSFIDLHSMFETGPQGSWSLLLQVAWLAWETLGSPVPGLHMLAVMSSVHGHWESELRTSHSCSKHLLHWVISAVNPWGTQVKDKFMNLVSPNLLETEKQQLCFSLVVPFSHSTLSVIS